MTNLQVLGQRKWAGKTIGNDHIKMKRRDLHFWQGGKLKSLENLQYKAVRKAAYSVINFLLNVLLTLFESKRSLGSENKEKRKNRSSKLIRILPLPWGHLSDSLNKRLQF